MRRKTMRLRIYHEYPEPKVRPARRRLIRHPYMAEAKGWLCQHPVLRWWNQNIRPATYKRF